tara:strand:+ start:3008 stop:3298 length:291 start_codon:yes stop_codon:yes gene_type:complete
MPKTRTSKTITTNTNTYIGTCPATGASVLINGTFNGATLTLGYMKGDNTVVPFVDTDATGTSNFEVNTYAGSGVKIYAITSGGGGTIDIDVVFGML